MKKEIKKLWVEALRSGEYEQGTGRLRTQSKKFCCLGVLCDLYIKNTGDGGWNNSDQFQGTKMFSTASSFLPASVMIWSKIDTCNPRVKDNDGDDMHLASLNDCGTSFEEIANIIEKQL